MAFEKGHKLAPGGARPGAGRTPDWLKARCQEIVDKVKVIEFLGSVVAGEDVEQAVGDQGEVIRVPASVRDKIKASEILLDRAYGKVGQPVDITLAEQSELAPVPTDLVQSLVAAFAGGTQSPSSGRAGEEA